MVHLLQERNIMVGDRNKKKTPLGTTLQEEAVCAICLDYFTDPVSIGCGHNFCRVCVTQLWGGEDEDQFTCPQCRKSFTRRSFRPNLQLANMVQIIRQMCPTPYQGSRGNNQGTCYKHQEALKLFCEVDKEAICVVCRESRSHKQHSVVPLEEVVQEYKESSLLAVIMRKEKVRGCRNNRAEKEETVRAKTFGGFFEDMSCNSEGILSHMLNHGPIVIRPMSRVM
ncbi:unnamed protein product [Nyctereutes procyonoides]|uniref:(raccoon dog) hypothetical protein n=1 Tax=Nyctereutes procyonoides TaxID=34880 RepID=A0A811ZH03_NYCPR|nr:unnamed protein product [Nyctereutes procyonoides]